MSLHSPPKSLSQDLHYPLELSWAPPAGEPFEVYPGVFWLNMPIPIQLKRINLWLLRDGDAWTIVDTGMYDEGCKAVWQKVFDNFCPIESVNRIIVTHYHPDHLGLAEWLSSQADCPVLISADEYGAYQSIRRRKPESLKQAVTDFGLLIGADEEFQAMYIKAGTPSSNAILKPERCQLIDESFELTIGDIHWKAVKGNGHSPEHICLFSEGANLLISGDQALPRISSNISIHIDNKDQDPLHDWITSCEKLRDTLPADVLVLPAHQEPFFGLHLRMQQLID